MTPRHRLTLVLPLALLMAAAVARAELGADTEASALFTPAFVRALPVAAVVGWLRAGALSVLVLVAAGLAGAMILPVVRPEGGPAALLLALPYYPLAWGSALFGAVAAQLMALRQRRADA